MNVNTMAASRVGEGGDFHDVGELVSRVDHILGPRRAVHNAYPIGGRFTRATGYRRAAFVLSDEMPTSRLRTPTSHPARRTGRLVPRHPSPASAEECRSERDFSHSAMNGHAAGDHARAESPTRHRHRPGRPPRHATETRTSHPSGYSQPIRGTDQQVRRRSPRNHPGESPRACRVTLGASIRRRTTSGVRLRRSAPGSRRGRRSRARRRRGIDAWPPGSPLRGAWPNRAGTP